jgi:hypothetical protein
MPKRLTRSGSGPKTTPPKTAKNQTLDLGLWALDLGLWTCLSVPDARPSFLFADEPVSNTIRGEADMTSDKAMITDICCLPGDGAGFRANSGLKPQEYSGSILGLIYLHLAKVVTLPKRIHNPRRTRDLLLPRLLSGQVELETEAA